MPSALKMLHPHLMIKGEKTKLGSSFHVDQEVSANSQSPCDIQEGTRRFTMYSKSQSILHEQFGRSETSGPRMNRWKSEPRMSTIGGSSVMPLSRSQEMEPMLSNRESMRALSEFLRTKEPPPGNFMSIPDPGNSDRNRMKRSALKLFGKHTRTKPTTPRSCCACQIARYRRKPQMGIAI
ncbi:hypothetical protein B0O99DRAFT_252574 [Bisporella sp. PMI_857]|nr:hypothetical protein B0O99DRAFT_252574 [Bisporella sp. PMI_857]